MTASLSMLNAMAWRTRMSFNVGCTMSMRTKIVSRLGVSWQFGVVLALVVR